MPIDITTLEYKQRNIILDENYNFSEKDTTEITLDFLNKLTPVQLILLENKIKQDIEKNKIKKHKKIQIRYISGPNTISLHINHNMKKNIYIIGESHNTVDRCKEIEDEGKGENIISFIDILTNMSINNNLIVDIYVETHIDKKNKKNKTENMKEIYTIFNRCFEHTDNNSYHNIYKCRLIRTHYIDIRFVENNPFRNILDTKNLPTLEDVLHKNMDLQIEFERIYPTLSRYLIDILKLDVDNDLFTFVRIYPILSRYLIDIHKLNVKNNLFTYNYFKNTYLPAIFLISQDSKQYNILLKQLTKSYFNTDLFYYLLYKFTVESNIRTYIKLFLIYLYQMNYVYTLLRP